MTIVDNVVSGVKKVREISQKLHDAELTSVIAELMVSAAGLKLELAELRSENLELRGQIQQLRQKADIRSKLVKRGNFYYLREPIEGYDEGPFCLTCMDVDGLLVGIKIFRYSNGTDTKCARCSNQRRQK